MEVRAGYAVEWLKIAFNIAFEPDKIIDRDKGVIYERSS